MNKTDIINHKKGIMYGLAIGDSLGSAVEFREPGEFPPVIGYRGLGPHHLEAGEWTDDTSMALALADSIGQKGWDTTDQLTRYVEWYMTGKYSVNGRCFDIGTTTRYALNEFHDFGKLVAEHDDFSAGNGSIMRLAPVVIKYAQSPLLPTYAEESSKTTHSHKDAVSGCRFLAVFLQHLVMGYEKISALDHTMDEECLTPFIKSIRNTYHIENLIKGSGYVVKSLEAALWAFMTSNTFEECVLKAVNLGNDSDTTGAVAGQMAGAFYGYNQIPPSLIDGLQRKDMIDLYLNPILE